MGLPIVLNVVTIRTPLDMDYKMKNGTYYGHNKDYSSNNKDGNCIIVKNDGGYTVLYLTDRTIVDYPNDYFIDHNYRIIEEIKFPLAI